MFSDPRQAEKFLPVPDGSQSGGSVAHPEVGTGRFRGKSVNHAEGKCADLAISRSRHQNVKLDDRGLIRGEASIGWKVFSIRPRSICPPQ